MCKIQRAHRLVRETDKQTHCGVFRCKTQENAGLEMDILNTGMVVVDKGAGGTLQETMKEQQHLREDWGKDLERTKKE